MEDDKCFICMEPQKEENMVRLCKCRESAICLEPCFQQFINGKIYDIENNFIKMQMCCPICKKELNYQSNIIVDWKKTKYLLTNYFLTIWWPFVTIIWPLVYLYHVPIYITENEKYAESVNKALGALIQIVTVTVSMGFYKLSVQTVFSITYNLREYIRDSAIYYTVANCLLIILDNTLFFWDNRFLRTFFIVNSLPLLISGIAVCGIIGGVFFHIGIYLFYCVPKTYKKIGLELGCLKIRPIIAPE